MARYVNCSKCGHVFRIENGEREWIPMRKLTSKIIEQIHINDNCEDCHKTRLGNKNELMTKVEKKKVSKKKLQYQDWGRFSSSRVKLDR